MKKIAIFLLCNVLMVGCAPTEKTTIVYSGAFKLDLPTSELNNAKILFIDGLSIKFSNQATISGLIITKELESLPSSFNLHQYPSYALGLTPVNELPKTLQDKFISSSDEVSKAYNSPKKLIYKNSGKETYIACGDNSCIEFIVNNDVSDHILMITTTGFAQEKLIELTKGI